MAEWRLERGDESDLDHAISNVQSFLQSDQNGPHTPDAWRLLATAYYKQGQAIGEIHAFVERAQFPSVPYFDLSSTASLLNRKYGDLDLEDGKADLAQRLLNVMEQRSREANADDYSRMAWLAMNLFSYDKARSFAQAGLNLNPENVHCSSIATRLRILP